MHSCFKSFLGCAFRRQHIGAPAHWSALGVSERERERENEREREGQRERERERERERDRLAGLGWAAWTHLGRPADPSLSRLVDPFFEPG